MLVGRKKNSDTKVTYCVITLYEILRIFRNIKTENS